MAEVPLTPRMLNILRTASLNGHSCFTPGDFCYRWQTETSAGAPVEIRIWRDEVGREIAFGWLSGDHLHIVSNDESE